MTLSDQAARDRARDDHATSFVLEAGAGTGKTTLLVERVLSMVTRGTATLDQIAAVTFTENAATTLKLRLREALENARADPARPADEQQRAQAALDSLERAPISTIHALCAGILSERPLEAGVVPGFQVADDAEVDRLFQEAWDAWLAEKLQDGEPALLEALDSGIPLATDFTYAEKSSLRGLARRLLEQRDLSPIVSAAEPDVSRWREELLAQTSRLEVLARAADSNDTLAPRALQLAAQAEATRGLEGAALKQALLSLDDVPHSGDKRRWPSAEALQDARTIVKGVKEAKARWAAEAGAALHARLMRLVSGVVDRYQEKKRASGRLDFLDLLLLARRALERRESVRAHFKDRFRHVIIDEFQDTDPVQVEIAEALTGGEPGRLTVVGDPKQSIYRFRRAEVALFERLRDRASSTPGHQVLHLTQNFRSRPAIVRFVNRVFESLIERSPDGSQPAYGALQPRAGLDQDRAVLALRFEAFEEEGPGLLELEAQAAAAFVARAAAGGFPVRDGAQQRASRAGDVMVLSRRFTQLRFLEDALERAGIAFVVEGGKSFFDRAEVHETLSLLRACDDPSDQVSLVGALRSSFFGVSDRDLVSYALAGGTLRPGLGDESLPGAANLVPALQLLGELHERRTRDSVASLLEELYARTRVQAALVGTRRGGARISNLDKIATLARQAAASGVLTSRGFISLLAERVASAREEPDLPETRPSDPDTVRVLSIHRAKGLEAPVVLLHDTADKGGNPADTISLWTQHQVAIGFRKGCQPPGWDELKKQDDRKALAESRRLLYVACTRARDWLVVPQPRGANLGDFWKPLLDRLPARDDEDVQILDAATLPIPETVGRPPALRLAVTATGIDRVASDWDRQRKDTLGWGGHRDFAPVSASAVAAREAVAGVRRGGSSTARDFGSLVHRILQCAPLDLDPAEAELQARRLAAGLAPAHGLDPEGALRAAAGAEAALRSPLWARARGSARAFRELPVWLPQEGELIEGVVDLAFEDEGQWVVVDWKTDAITEQQALEQAAHHAPQLRLYGRALTLATGVPVRERVVFFTALARAVPV